MNLSERQRSDLYDAVAGYEDALRTVCNLWLSRWFGHSIDDTNREKVLRELADDMDELAIALLPYAYLLGFGWDELSALGGWVVEQQVQRNRTYLLTSLIPYVRKKLNTVLTGESTIARRVSLYAQPYWTTIWYGLRERAKNLIHYVEAPVRVERSLDPGVDHCPTCPPKAGVYDSWEDMVWQCGGVPADGSDDCGPACRCGLRLLY